MPDEPKKVSFDLGPLVATPGALKVLEENNMTPAELLARHVSGDWGNLCEEDKAANAVALQKGARIMSSYTLPDKSIIWVITDAEIDEHHHRYATTLLLPEDY
ncbi:MAG: type I restriction endonuclease subunit M [Candidatus Hydrogenedentes bacterium]|nr:type I restriction endonuclease subunit M [Candidatus Hydrogenedentota bacterium]